MITVGNRTLGPGRPCLVVAELGTGHLGSMTRARDLVDAAAASGADCAKFQLVYADEILHPRSGAVDLPTGRIELYRRFRELEQPISFYAELKRYVESKGLLFLCAPFGLRSARELCGIGVAAIKIASPELNHVPLLEEVAGYGLPLVLSSGVSTLGDIERALAVTGRDRVVLLHCITAYPAPETEYNVSLLASLATVFGVEVGLSDHSLDPVLVPALAVLHGARVLEKHFTLSRAGAGLDDPIALEPAAFARMVATVRDAEAAGPAATLDRLEMEYGAGRVRLAIGSGVKDLAPSERANYRRTNRSIHAVGEIRAGDEITAEAVAVLRTEKVLRPGLAPEFLPVVLGRRAARDIPPGEGVTWEDVG
jgi:sialic acid synthase SpsE